MIASLAAAAFLAFAANAGAATIAVTTLADEIAGGPGDTGCALREAIMAANTDTDGNGCTRVGAAGADTINLPSTGTIDLTTLGTALAITTPIDIVGPGPNLIVTNTNTSSRIFSVAAGPTVHISGIDISSGDQVGTGTQQGGAISNSGTLVLSNVHVTASQAVATDTAGAVALGGSIYNQGTLTLDTSSIKNSHATATETGAGGLNISADGGAVYSTGPLTLTKSTIDDSHASASKLSGAEDSTARGGGIYASGALLIDHSTISNNTAAAHADGPFAIVFGGGIYTTASASIELSTVTANTTDPMVFVTGTAQQAGGGIYSQAPGNVTLRSDTIVSNGPVSGSASGGSNLRSTSGTVKNTILALPIDPGNTCSGSVTSLGYNDEFSFTGGSTSCGLGTNGDISVAPGLGPLTQANGGPTATMLPGGGSGVIDKGSSAGSTDATHDQRGLSRPDEFSDITDGPFAGDGTDIGAVEVQIAPPTFTAATPVSPSSVDTPVITGVAQAGSTVNLFTDAACTGAQTGPTTTSALFATPGITASPVVHNATTTFHGTTTKPAYGTSLCSSGSFPNTITYTQADPPGSGGPSVTPPTGQRAAALKKCKKKKGKARKKCKKKALKLPV